MTSRKKILAICGSTRKASSNLNLINIIAEISRDKLDIQLFDGLTEIPNFNPDLDNDAPPPQVTNFRNAIKEADGVLICTPEYAMGVVGALKNAIDWTVSSCEFSHKPTALITASSQGFKAHASLLETLKIIECYITDKTQLVIPFVKTKVSAEKITDPATLEEVKGVISAMTGLFAPEYHK